MRTKASEMKKLNEKHSAPENSIKLYVAARKTMPSTHGIKPRPKLFAFSDGIGAFQITKIIEMRTTKIKTRRTRKGRLRRYKTVLIMKCVKRKRIGRLLEDTLEDISRIRFFNLGAREAIKKIQKKWNALKLNRI